MRLLHEIAIFQTVKSKVIISLFETVRLSISISLRNICNSLNRIKEKRVHSFYSYGLNNEKKLNLQSLKKMKIAEFANSADLDKMAHLLDLTVYPLV